MVDNLYASTTPDTAPRYEYYTVDIITNEVLAQIPFEDVSYERKLKDFGAFEGSITVSGQTEDLDLYNSTLPGKTALYVVRNGVCVWGGIIWGRTYDLVARALSISAAEFTSYLSHRNIWKTYSFKFEAEVLKATKSGYAKVTILNSILKKPLDLEDDKGVANKVYISFSDSDLVKYSGYYPISNFEEPTQTTFWVSIPKLPAASGSYTNVTVSARVDTYEYIREMLKDVLVDFKDTQFANETIAPGIKLPNIITEVGASNNSVTITTDSAHSLVKGQIVEIYNITKALCGKHIISEVLTPTQFKYTIPILSITHVSRVSADNTAIVYFDTSETASTQVNPFVVGQIVTINASDNNFDATATITEVTEKSISYDNSGIDVAKTLATGSITVPNVTFAPVATNSILVDSREISTTRKKSIEYVKRVDGYVWMWTTEPHGFKKTDKVTIKSKKYADLNNNDIPVSILYATDTYFKYYQPNLTAKKNDIKSAGGGRIKIDSPKQNTAVLATPLNQLKINTQSIHSFERGDLVYVEGVDRIDWTKPVYNGYHKVVDLDISEGTLSTDVLKSTHYEITSNITAKVWLNRAHGILPGDSIQVAGSSSVAGKFVVSDIYDPEDAVSGISWIQYSLSRSSTNVSKTAISVEVIPYGSTWFTFDMPEYGVVREPDDTVEVTHVRYRKKKRTVTITTARRHNCVPGDRIKVDLKKKVYDGTFTVKSVSTDVDELSYSLPSNTENLPANNTGITKNSGSITRVKTKVGSIPTLEVSIERISRKGNTARAYSTDHDLNVGDPVSLEFSNVAFSSFENSNAISNITLAEDNIFEYTSSGSTFGYRAVSRANVVKKIATIITSAAHEYAAGQSVSISGITDKFNGIRTIKAITNTTAFTYDLDATNITTAITPTAGYSYSTVPVGANVGFAYLNYLALANTEEISAVASSSGVVTMISQDHGFDVGTFVTTYIYDKAYKAFRNNNESVKLTAVTDNTFTYTALSSSPTGTVANVATSGIVAVGPQVRKIPVAIARTYGEFPENSNIGGLEFSTNEYSNSQFPNDIIRGSDLISVAEHLERYTNTRDGFDYRIDCNLVEGQDNKKIFKRTFMLVPRAPETLKEYLKNLPNGVLERGTYAPVSAFGADKLVFEYPGNIQNVSFSESANESATRVFVAGNNSDLGAGAGARFSAASDTLLLNSGWPILDRVEKVEWPLVGINQINVDNWGNYDSEADMQKTAERFLKESKPPVGDFIITVNGSLMPEVGTYYPGDYCSLIVNDNFVRQRMNSILEPRKDVIVRRVDGVKVQVPNSPAFPEMIDLELVTEWQVDTRGQ
jgi:hypothetical protein